LFYRAICDYGQIIRGCTLSSAVAAGLAKGLGLGESVREAKAYVTAAIAASDRLAIGKGHGPVHHFHRWW
jgi:hydroxymethylpyrimidine/phosphomethylpyrimidine kinase